jgi:hypothetical protein
VDLSDPDGGILGAVPVSTITLSRSVLPNDLVGTITTMMAAHFAYLERATGSAATVAGMPPLVTTEGLVKNSQHPETLLGGYFPANVAVSEGAALMMRGIAQAYAVTEGAGYKAYFDFLLDATIEHFFFGVEPPTNAAAGMPHGWIVNAGDAFAVRGPTPANGRLDQSGHIGVPVTFTGGVGQIAGTPPAVVYQVVTNGSEFVWPNVFAELVTGTGSNVAVSYYIDADGNRVFGVQKGGSFGQPIQPGSTEPPGRIVLASPVTGTYLVSYSVSVPGVTIARGESFEGWPMWRKLMPAEVSIASDAIHWFVDAFKIMAEAVPSEPRYSRALAAMLVTWQRTCAIEGTDTTILKAGAIGPYNSYPLTYAFAYGRSNVDNPATEWSAVPPDARLPVARTPDGYVTFTLPAANALPGSGGEVRYGVSFENEPLFLEYTPSSAIVADIRAGAPTVVRLDAEAPSGEVYSALALAPTTTAPLTLAMPTFKMFQNTPGDSLGLDSGDWTSAEEDEYVPPVYSAVPFPGRRTALVGDSITWMNTFWMPPTGTPSPYGSTPSSTGGGGGAGGGAGGTAGVIPGLYEYYAHSMTGFFTAANQIMGQRLTLEPFLEDRQLIEAPPVSRYRNGNNFGIAGSRTINWELGQDNTLGDGVFEVGPMFNARRYLSKFDVVVMTGGTNDLAGAQTTASTVFQNLRRFAYEFAAAGKWVFVQTIMPRSREWLGGYLSPAGAGWTIPASADPSGAYTIAKQDLVRQRILDVNQMLRDWIATDAPPNIWLVDSYNDLAGPNGLDPAGHVSHPTDPLAPATRGNWKPGFEGVPFFYDRLHPGPGGAFVAGQRIAATMIAAGVPARGTGAPDPLTIGPNLVANPNFNITTTRAASPNGKSTLRGRARGLGTALFDATRPQWIGATPKPANYDHFANLGLGYQHGPMPDHWQFYRSRNNFNPADPMDFAEGWSNFNEYTWTALASQFPILNQYTSDATWPDGAVTTAVVTMDGTPTFRITVNIPQTGNRAEAFVFRTLVPAGQRGHWDDYGYAEFDWAAWFATNTVGPTQDQIATIPNNLYAPGDRLYAEADVKIDNASQLYTWRMAMAFLSMDSSAISEGDNSTTGSPIVSYANSQNFWPPDMLEDIRSVPTTPWMKYRTPVVQAPGKTVLQNQYFLQYNFEFSFDASQGPATAIIHIRSPNVRKVTGGNLK